MKKSLLFSLIALTLGSYSQAIELAEIKSKSCASIKTAVPAVSDSTCAAASFQVASNASNKWSVYMSMPDDAIPGNYISCRLEVNGEDLETTYCQSDDGQPHG